MYIRLFIIWQSTVLYITLWSSFIHGCFLSAETFVPEPNTSGSRYYSFVALCHPFISLIKNLTVTTCLSTIHQPIRHWKFLPIKLEIPAICLDMPFLSFWWYWFYIRFSTDFNDPIPVIAQIILVPTVFFIGASMLRCHRKIHIQV